MRHWQAVERGIRAVAAAVAATAVMTLSGCGTVPPPFDPNKVHQTQVNRAGELQPATLPTIPTTLESPYLDAANTGSVRPASRPAVVPATQPTRGEALVRMTLQEIIQPSVLHNHEVKVAGYEPAIEGTRVVTEEARFDPTFFSNLRYTEQAGFGFGFNSNSINDSTDHTENATGSAGVRQLLPSGGEIEVRYQVQFQNLDNQAFVENPYFQNDLILQLTQPLLRDFGRDVNRARIEISQNNQAISFLDFRDRLEETLFTIEEVYWQLVQAERDAKILEDLLQRTLETADILVQRSRQDVTRVQISQTNSRVESRRALLIRARARIRDRSDRLKQLMNDPDMPVSSSIVILPASSPSEQGIIFDLPEQIETAINNRLELAQQRLRIESAGVASRVAKNNLLPQLNLVGSVGAKGVDEHEEIAFSNNADLDYVDWQVGLEFEIPLGNRAARSAYKRTQLQRSQAIEGYEARVQDVALEVSTSLREVETTYALIAAARRSKFAADDALQGILQRERASEALTPEFVQLKLDRQAELATAEQTEAEAISEYNTAIARLERAKGTLLRYNNVVMEEEMEDITAPVSPTPVLE